MQILLSNSQAGPVRTAKQGQEEMSLNHVQAFIPGSVQNKCDLFNKLDAKHHYWKGARAHGILVSIADLRHR